MNIVFTLLTLASLVMLLISSPEIAFPTMLEGVKNAINLALKLTAIYTVWLSALKMMEATSLDKKLSSLLRPLIKRLFKGESDEAMNHISVNLAGNLLGMGGVATPAGIKAISAMAKDGQEVASNNMILLLVLNATSLQLIPATVIAIRAGAGSENAASIFLPTLISTTVSTLSGLLICKTLSLKKDSKTNKNSILYRTKQRLNSRFCKFKKDKTK